MTVIELLVISAMFSAFAIEWRAGNYTRLSTALWAAVLVALVILDAWPPLIALYGVIVGGQVVALAVEGN